MFKKMVGLIGYELVSDTGSEPAIFLNFIYSINDQICDTVELTSVETERRYYTNSAYLDKLDLNS